MLLTAETREVKKGLDVIASQGLHTGGLPPLGYDVSEKRLVINESEEEIVRLIFDRYSNGYTYNDIAKELNAKGYKTKIGREFTSASLNSILNQRKYIGEYVYNERSSKNINGSYNSHKNKPEEEIIRIPDAVPKIIDKKIFEKVQQRLEMNKRKAGHYKSGMLKIIIEISRTELKTLPKQRRKVPANGQFGENDLK